MQENLITEDSKKFAEAIEFEASLISAETFLVKDHLEFDAASAKLKEVKAQAKKLDEKRREMTRPLDASKQAIMDFFRPVEAQLVDAERVIKQAMLKFSQEQARIQELERKRLQDEANERARVERERLEAEAMAALATGNAAKSEERLTEAETVTAPIMKAPDRKPTASGVAIRKIRKARVLDVKLVPREFMIVNEPALNALAKTTEGPSTIPGVEFYTEESLAQRF